MLVSDGPFVGPMRMSPAPSRLRQGALRPNRLPNAEATGSAKLLNLTADTPAQLFWTWQ